jgi:hypothetical protein
MHDRRRKEIDRIQTIAVAVNGEWICVRRGGEVCGHGEKEGYNRFVSLKEGSLHKVADV